MLYTTFQSYAPKNIQILTIRRLDTYSLLPIAKYDCQSVRFYPVSVQNEETA